jgi:hypothetical protein
VRVAHKLFGGGLVDPGSAISKSTLMAKARRDRADADMAGDLGVVLGTFTPLLPATNLIAPRKQGGVAGRKQLLGVGRVATAAAPSSGTAELRVDERPSDETARPSRPPVAEAWAV